MTGESPLNLFGRSAVLFLPASNPRAIAKAKESDADLVILDLEDAVRQDDKLSARSAAVAAVAEEWPMPVAIRVNGPAAEWHDNDVAAVAVSKADLIVVPCVFSALEIESVRARLGQPVAAMVEKAAAVLDVLAIARISDALIVGTNDLAADLRRAGGVQAAEGDRLNRYGRRSLRQL